jgi:membrane protein CcdC involved in cytochrome C biogenesis
MKFDVEGIFSFLKKSKLAPVILVGTGIVVILNKMFDITPKPFIKELFVKKAPLEKK